MPSHSNRVSSCYKSLEYEGIHKSALLLGRHSPPQRLHIS